MLEVKWRERRWQCGSNVGRQSGNEGRSFSSSQEQQTTGDPACDVLREQWLCDCVHIFIELHTHGGHKSEMGVSERTTVRHLLLSSSLPAVISLFGNSELDALAPR